MKNAAMGMMLACAAMACASNKTMLPEPLASAHERAHDRAHAPDEIVKVADAPRASVGDGSWIGAAAGSDYVLTGGQDQFIGVWVDVPKAQKRPYVPMSITLSIDTSGSMAGEKIERAREAARTLVSKMHEGDMVSIQSFNTTATELVAPTVLNKASRALVMGTIAELQADGATNMSEALDLAIQRARSAPSSFPVRRVVLISDGRATAGQTNGEVLAQLAESGSAFGVQVTSLGVGIDYDEATLNALAVRSSGRLYHLSDPKEMSGIIKGELALLQSTMATGAFVEVVPAPGVTLVGASGAVRTTWGENSALRIPLGTMFAGQRREVLIRFRLSTDEVEGKRSIASARLHYTDPAEDDVPRVQEVVVRGELTNDPELCAANENPEVQAIIAMQQASTLTLAAASQVNDGNFDDADAQLAMAEKDLRAKAKKVTHEADRKRMTAAAEGIAKSRRSVKAAASSPRASPRPAALELNDQAMDYAGF